MIHLYTIYCKTYLDGQERYVFFTHLGGHWAGLSFYPGMKGLEFSDEYRDDKDQYWTTEYIEGFNIEFARRILKFIFPNPTYFD
jgi:hypothetical protein